MVPDLTLFYMQIFGGFGGGQFSDSAFGVGPMGACNAFLSLARGIPQAGNPPYTVTDFLAVYPKFGGPVTSVSGSAVVGISQITNVPDAKHLGVGQLVIGTFIQPGTVITGVATTPIAVTGDTTAGSAGILNVSSLEGLLVGQPISGPGIPDCAVIKGIGTDSLLIFPAATATAAGASLQATVATLSLSLSPLTTGSLTAGVLASPPMAPMVIQVYINLAFASLMSSRWREAWPIAMGWYIAHFLTLYLQSDGVASSAPGQVAVSGLQRGITVSKSADGLSMGLQPVQGLDSWAAWTTTTYGVQLATMAKVVGAGMIYVR